MGGCGGCWHGLVMPGSPSWGRNRGQSWAEQQPGHMGTVTSCGQQSMGERRGEASGPWSLHPHLELGLKIQPVMSPCWCQDSCSPAGAHGTAGFDMIIASG